MKAYSLAKKTNTDELHVFEGQMTETSCTAAILSICEKMNWNKEFAAWEFYCKKEEEAWVLCANKGRKVCGTCVSHLYTTYR